MNPGDVVRWINYPFQKDGPPKPRWLICLGTMKTFGQESQLFLSTTTTQLSYYESGGKREKNPKAIIKRSALPFFESDCIIDFLIDEPRPFFESLIIKNHPNIEFKGKIPNEPMREIFNSLVRSGVVNKKIAQILRQSLIDAGYSGLAKP